MKKYIRILTLCLAVLCIVLSTGCSSVSKFESIPVYNEDMKFTRPSGFIAAQNERFSLEWDSENRRVLLLDKTSGKTWSNVPEALLEERLDESGDKITNNVQIEAPIIVEYYESDTQNVKNANGYTASLKKNSFSVEKTEKGMKVTYAFKKEQFSVPVYYELEKDHITVTIKPQEISELKNRVYGVTVAPFSCSVKNKEGGYLFVPSGSGALIYANKDEEIVQSYSAPVYGDDLQRYPKNRIVASNSQNINLPVFGSAEKNGVGCMGIITSGAGSAYINVNYGNANIGYSSVYPKFNLRGYQNATALVTTWKWESQVYAQALGSTPVTVAYYPLLGEQASYMGMAEVYRNYLIEKYSLDAKTEDNLLSVKLLGGTYIKKSALGVPYSSMFSTTNLSQAKEIVSDITNTLGVSPTVNLVGYGDNGLNVGKIGGGYTINSAFGGRKGFDELNKYCKETNTDLFMDFDIISYSKSGKGFSKITDSALAPNYRATTQLRYNVGNKSASSKNSFYLIRRELIPTAVDKLISTANNLNIRGVALDLVSRVNYSDYREQKYFAGGLIESDISSQLKRVKESGKNVMVTSANDYAAAVADIICEAPHVSNKDTIFNEEIPFYQIVFKGYVPMTGGSLNLAVNEQDYILRCAQVGSGLMLTLSYDYTDKLQGTYPDMFYASVYADVKDNALKTVKDYSEFYNKVKGAEISDYQVISKSLCKTVFSNGVSVYVNYSDNDITSGDVTVPAKSYVYKQG